MTLGAHTLGTVCPGAPEHMYYDYSMMGPFCQPDQLLSIYSASHICDQALANPGIYYLVGVDQRKKRRRNKIVKEKKKNI